ncbi:MAG: 2-amino-4-hydroxy-6-hydroxymethyldihydropteridine diphosphokinase [Mycoplasmataceae bacterium]|nr:2-amino-4-hydroxy-6-hydroxymethyldihydropteridine diphosphokinase [Mycoplasmataceae bacterium]
MKIKNLSTLSLGSNLMHNKMTPKNIIKKAIFLLNKNTNIKVKKISPLIKTKPVGIIARKDEKIHDFINATVLIETTLKPIKLLSETQKIENLFNRLRSKNSKIKWSRTLDIDIIFFNSIKIKTKNLIIPHPRYHKRDFVLKPMGEMKNFDDVKWFCKK